MLPVQSGMKTAIDGVVFTDLRATKKSRLQKFKVKTLLIAFFDNKRIIHKEFVPVGQTINACIFPGSFEPIATAYPAVSARLENG